VSEWALVPIRHVASLNPEVLPEDLDPETPITYVDIGAVGSGELTSQPDQITFGNAPSRARRVVHAGDVIISTVRTYLRAVLPITDAEDGFVVSTGFAVLRPRMIEPRYAGWLLQSDIVVDEVVARSVGVSYPAISPSDLAGVKVPVPPPAVQLAIADYLDRESARINALIAAKRRMMTLARESSAVVLLDAVTPAPDRPQVETRRTLRKVVRPLLDGSGVVTAFRDGHVMLRSRRREEGFTESDTLYGYQGVLRGDVVFHGLDGFAGAIGVSEDDGMCSPVYHVCVALEGYDAVYVAQVLRALALSDFLALQAGNVRERAVDFRNWDALARIPIPVRPLHQQRALALAFVNRRSWAERLSEQLHRQLTVLEERRRALITAAVTGEMEIPGAAA
jgi:type I restriction enzyme, S subunit